MSQLEDYIRSNDIHARLITLDQPTPTVQEAARVLGVSAGEIIKSILFSDHADQVILVIARGTARIDPKKVAAVAGTRRLRLASPEVVLARTGYPAGGTPPIGHAERLPVVMDRGVLKRHSVYGGGGSTNCMLHIAARDIVQLTGAIVADIALDAQDPPTT